MTGMGAGPEPLVSVVIPTYDRPDYLRIALAGVVAQTHRNLEIIVCDNASPRDPTPVVASFADPRIRLYRNARNLGPTPNTLLAVGMAAGDYVAILGDDDLWQPDFLATLLAPMERDPAIVVSFCNHDIIDGQGAPNAAATDRITRRFGRHLLRDGVYRSFDEIALVYRAICIVSGAVIRRGAIDWASIPHDLPMSVDLYIAYLLATAGGSCAYTARRLMQYRYHALQNAHTYTNIRRSWRADLRWTLDLWMIFLRDERLTCRRYLKMICTRKALVILLDRLQRRDLRGLGGDVSQFWRWGLLDPRALADHLRYFLQFQRRHMGRIVP